MRRMYLESSALLRALLDGDDDARTAIDGAEALCASELTFLEAVRAVIRAKHPGRLDAKAAREALREIAAVERECHLIALEQNLLRRAREEFPHEPVRTPSTRSTWQRSGCSTKSSGRRSWRVAMPGCATISRRSASRWCLRPPSDGSGPGRNHSPRPRDRVSCSTG